VGGKKAAALSGEEADSLKVDTMHERLGGVLFRCVLKS
jgi:hypothetical protein